MQRGRSRTLHAGRVPAAPAEPPDPEVVAAKREQANDDHHAIVRALNAVLVGLGCTHVKEIPGAIDLWATRPHGTRPLGVRYQPSRRANAAHLLAGGLRGSLRARCDRLGPPLAAGTPGRPGAGVLVCAGPLRRVQLSRRHATFELACFEPGDGRWYWTSSKRTAASATK